MSDDSTPAGAEPRREAEDGLWSVLHRAREVGDAHRSRGEPVPAEVREAIEMLEASVAEAVSTNAPRPKRRAPDSPVGDSPDDDFRQLILRVVVSAAAIALVAVIALALSIIALVVALN